ncbi:MAG: aldo/keto reductase [Woeseia sp.]
MTRKTDWSRREFLEVAALASLTPALSMAAQDTSMQTREIPGSGELLPLIGLGTYDVFDVAGTPEELAERNAIIELLLEKGGSLVDTSPMYNRSERIIGTVLNATGRRTDTFLATKVWTNGAASGIAQMTRSAELMRTDVIDLMQVHNLRDLNTHFRTLREWQQHGRIRYTGITHYHERAFDEMEAAMRRYRPDFIQINYSLGERTADERLLPLAADMGIAVLINRPYQAGALFSKVRGQELPDWAREFAASWGQFFLKYIVSHPAVNCAIPATSKPHHMADNLGAGFGSLPNAAMRQRMLEHFTAL